MIFHTFLSQDKKDGWDALHVEWVWGCCYHRRRIIVIGDSCLLFYSSNIVLYFLRINLVSDIYAALKLAFWDNKDVLNWTISLVIAGQVNFQRNVILTQPSLLTLQSSRVTICLGVWWLSCHCHTVHERFWYIAKCILHWLSLTMPKYLLSISDYSIPRNQSSPSMYTCSIW